MPLILVGLPLADEREMYAAQLASDGFSTAFAEDTGDLLKQAQALQPHPIVLGQGLRPDGGERVCARSGVIIGDEGAAR